MKPWRTEHDEITKDCQTFPRLFNEPKNFWHGTRLLHIQKAGNSQNEMIALMKELLAEMYGIDPNAISQQVAGDNRFVYIDDGVFSGNRLISDVSAWLPQAPDQFDLH